MESANSSLTPLLLPRREGFATGNTAKLVCLMMLCACVYAQGGISVEENFGNAGSGSFPSTLIQGGDRKLYGNASFGEGSGYSFAESLSGGMVTVVHHFDGTDGSEPTGGLVQGSDGNYYGVVAYSPAHQQSGIFRMTPEGVVIYIYEFTGGSDGGGISGDLLLGKDGKLYTVGYRGGAFGNGVIVSCTLDGVLTVLHSFTGADGSGPAYPLIQLQDGTLAGTAIYGGPSGGGVAFTINPASPSTSYKVLYAFSAGQYPVGIVQGNDGNFYIGTTSGGNNGSVYKITPAGLGIIIHTFTDGVFPYHPLIKAKDGYIYGVGDNTGSKSGNLFRFGLADPFGSFEILYTFVGGNPNGTLLQASDGNLYGPLQDGRMFKVILQVPTLANISTRMQVGTNQSVSIGGFIITGTEAKQVVVRVLGPSLFKQGVVGFLVDPTLELHDSTGALVASNDNWQTTVIGGFIQGDQVVAIQASQLAPTNPAESALIATLSPGAYTAVVRGAGNSAGVGLVEIYDLDSAVDSKLANISTRGQVQTGSDVMIGGIIVTGTDSTQVVLRALGPSLSSKGISNPLPDPTLELHDSDGDLIVSNDNWEDGGQVTEIEATGLAPGDPAESVIMITLAPGEYTAVVQGAKGTMGVGLVEAYQL